MLNSSLFQPPENVLDSIQERLFLGQIEALSLLKEYKITHVVSICEDAFLKGVEWPPGIMRLHLNLADNPQVMIRPFFDQVAKFIHEALKRSNHRVLVHCVAGRSRSASFMAAYLIRHGTPPSSEKALAFIRSRRPCINPNIGFRQQLMKYEAVERSRRDAVAQRRVLSAKRRERGKGEGVALMKRGQPMSYAEGKQP
jgi:protein-tyrosine phosphatase